MSTENKLYGDYINFHNESSKKYPNDKIFVLMQVGGFYESYCTDTVGPDLDEISKLIGVIKSKKGKDKPLNLKNPYCLGFPIVSKDKYCEILTNNNYLIIIVDQVQTDESEDVETKKPKKKMEERKITNVYTKGTFIQNIETNENCYIVCAYFSRDFQKGQKPLLSVGLTAVDISTGQVLVHEAYSNKYDEYMALDEADRFFTSLKPTEIMIYFSDNGKDKSTQDFKEQILSYLQLQDSQTKFIFGIDKKYTNSTFQNEILKIVYPSVKSMLLPIIQFDLEQNVYSNTSMAILFDIICDRDSKLLNNMSKPMFFINEQNLILGNNAIHQLDVIDSLKDTSNSKYRSLFNVVNNTSTPMGERFLKSRLLSPLVNNDEITKSYDFIELLINDSIYLEIEKFLNGIRDIERLQRRMQLKLLKPLEFDIVLMSYEKIKELITFILTTDSLKQIKSILPSKKSIESIDKLIKYVNDVFIFEELIKFGNLDIDRQIFKTGIHTKLDNLSNSSTNINDFYEEMCTELNKFVPTKNKPYITLKKTAKNSYYFKLTTAKANLLKSELNKRGHLIVNKIKYSSDLFKFAETGTANSKCTFTNQKKMLLSESDDPVKCKEKLLKLNRKYYLEELPKIYDMFKTMFDECNTFISNIDFIKSGAKTAKSLGYSRPHLIKQNHGSIDVKNLRHPIIERIISHEYVPHNVKIGDSLKGMMIYGLNGIGKCFDPFTKIMMYDGSIKMAKNINIGDKLMGDDSTARTVLSTTKGMGQMYKIIGNDYEFIVNGPHILCLVNKNLNSEKIKISVDEYLKKDANWKDKYIMYRVGVDYPNQLDQPDIDPYTYGKRLFDMINVVDMIDTADIKKTIPNIYKCNSKENRFKLFAGILDNLYEKSGMGLDIAKNTLIFNLNDLNISNNSLISDVISVGRSLGFGCKLFQNNISITGSVELFDEINVYFNSIHVKTYLLNNANVNPLVYSFKIEKLQISYYCGFEVDKNKKFLLEDFTVTHNSSYMKASGLAVILAQSGLFVPCDKMTLSPYNSLYTRITGDDNIFRGLSSFSLEMVELNAILKRANNKTLVIGDEVCRGTEHISGNALVASAIIKLSKAQSSFIFASHLHDIMEFDEVKEISSIKAFHLSVSYDKNNGLIYDRNMKEGTGEKIYGVTVAQHLIQDKEFIDMAVKFRNKLTNTYDGLLSGKSSTYNKNILVHECSICKTKDKTLHVSNLETHHINHQKDCENGIVKGKKHLKKNDEANLIVLCNECHDKIHNGSMILGKYVLTSEGRTITVQKK